MASDVLKQLSEKQVQGWYERLGRKVSADAKTAGVSSPLSGAFLLQYIGRNGNALGAVLDVDAPEHLKADSSVIDVQLFHRAVFLTEKKGNFRPAPDRPRSLSSMPASPTSPQALSPSPSCMRRSPPASGTSSRHSAAGS
jgi:hypothetical protein